MKVVVTGATGNVGTSLCSVLAGNTEVESIVGLSRRRPQALPDRVEWVGADIAETDLRPLFEGADAVVHLAWLIQPSLKMDVVERVNVEGSRRVFEAAAAVGVGSLVHASSIGAYSPRPDLTPTGESWPTGGIESSFYSRHKAAAESMLDDLAERHPEMRVVRLRPALIFKREAASEISRYFIGPFVPLSAIRPEALPALPWIKGLRFQAVHTDDVAHAYASAVLGEAEGAFNIAAPPLIDREVFQEAFGARAFELPAGLARGGLAGAFKARVVPTPPGWLDMALNVPVMDTARAERELGFSPRVGAVEALEELLDGLRGGAGRDTPPMVPRRRNHGFASMRSPTP